MATRTGLDVLRAESFARLRDLRLGVLCHAASVAADLTHILDLFTGTGLDLRVVFAPEHGLAAAAQDMQPVAGEGTAGAAGAPVISLYGDTEASLHPPADALSDIDLLVVDLQDVGARYYTFAATMRYCMQACAGAGVRVMVLDRPNPINGVTREGPLLEDGFRSFVGAFRVPVRHGLTIGELAKLAVDEGVDCELDVVRMQGWRREMWFDQTDLPWVMPSPNMPTLDTATVYPGACLIEATNLSEGRGTTRPFELIGAPWLDGRRLAAALDALELPGVRFRPVTFRPGFQKHAGLDCHGVQIHVTDRGGFQSFATGVGVLAAARGQAPDRFAWREPPYEFVSEIPAIDLLTGSLAVRQSLGAGGELVELVQSMRVDVWTPELTGGLLY